MKDGIESEGVIRAATWPLWIEHLDEDSRARQRRLGSFDSGNELVIHAVKARPQMLELLP